MVNRIQCGAPMKGEKERERGSSNEDIDDISMGAMAFAEKNDSGDQESVCVCVEKKSETTCQI